MWFYSLAMLAGLGVLVIPPLIHLLNRRRYDTIDWGAMQFLQMSEVTRRRMHLEELLLMGLRMGLLGVLVLALAGPFLDSASPWLQGGRPNRDVVLVFDGSASMSYTGTGKPAQAQAQEWALGFVDQLAPGDTVAVVQARQQPIVIGPLSGDRQGIKDRIGQLPAPGGSCDWPAAIDKARALLAEGQHGQRDVVLVSDNQRHGWADDRSMERWTDAALVNNEGPSLWVVHLDPRRPAQPPNWSLSPVQASRAVVATGEEVKFQTSIRLHGQTNYTRPHRLWLEVNGQFVKNLEAPHQADLERGQVPLSFKHRFGREPGPALVSIVMEPDLPTSEQPTGYAVRDHLPADNRRDYALEVVKALPVLLVDGDTSDDPRSRGSDFVRNALAPASDPSPVAQVKVVPAHEFGAAHLAESGTAKGQDERPRVVVLCNVARLTRDQQDALERFIRQGGGVLVAAGERADRAHYNDHLHRGGNGWLPARLERAEGDEAKVGDALRPLPGSFAHPALEMFRSRRFGGLENAWFARAWRLTTPGAGSASTAIALFDRDAHPLLVEGTFGEGRVILSGVPLDTSWRTNLTDLPSFVPLTHELVAYLASVRLADHNLAPGQPLRYRLPRDAGVEGLTLQPPVGEARPLAVDTQDDRQAFPAQLVQQIQGPILVSEGLREPGVWRLHTPDGIHPYVVQGDPAEADLTPLTGPEQQTLHQLTGLAFVDDPQGLRDRLGTGTARVNLWWWFLLGLIGLLCAEVFMTRWIVKNR